MNAAVIILFAIAVVECRKYVPISKNANTDFINMESGGVRPAAPARPASGPGPVNTVPASPTPAPAKAPPAQTPKTPEPLPKSPSSSTLVLVSPVVTPKPAGQTQPPVAPKPQPTQQPTQLDLKPVPSRSGPATGPSTPGYGNVQQLITYYDSQGKASPVRPHSYSQAVKQG